MIVRRARCLDDLAEFPSAKFIRINYSKDDGAIVEKVDDYFNTHKGSEDEMTIYCE